MKKAEIEGTATELAVPYVAELGLELVNVQFVQEGGNWYLRYFIDKPGGITLDDCQALSERVGKELDRLDPIPVSYYLEVSSPGAERPLIKDSDFVRFAGEYVAVKTFGPVQGKRNWQGYLVGKTDAGVTIKADDKEMLIPADMVARVRLAVKF